MYPGLTVDFTLDVSVSGCLCLCVSPVQESPLLRCVLQQMAAEIESYFSYLLPVLLFFFFLLSHLL